MPLKGVICDSDDPRFHGEKVSFEFCKACARESLSERWCNAPYALINGMASNGEERKDAGMSATMLLNPCSRQTILQQKYDYYERPSAYWPRFRGTLSHLLMEEYDGGGEGIIQEVRFRKPISVDIEINGKPVEVEIELTGKMDHVDTIQKVIIDYKSIKSINAQPVNKGEIKPEHGKQVSIYRWLLDGGTNMETGEVVHYEIERAGIIYFDMTGTVKLGAPLMSLEETEEYIKEKVRPIAQYSATGELPDLIQDDRGRRHWLCNYCPVKDICEQLAQEGK